jgi:hypothetical protein
VHTADWITDILICEVVSAVDDVRDMITVSLSQFFTATFKYKLNINRIIVKESSRSVSDLFRCAYGNILMPGLSFLHNISFT